MIEILYPPLPVAMESAPSLGEMLVITLMVHQWEKLRKIGGQLVMMQCC
jgi:hypothetical protein